MHGMAYMKWKRWNSRLQWLGSHLSRIGEWMWASELWHGRWNNGQIIIFEIHKSVTATRNSFVFAAEGKGAHIFITFLASCQRIFTWKSEIVHNSLSSCDEERLFLMRSEHKSMIDGVKDILLKNWLCAARNFNPIVPSNVLTRAQDEIHRRLST